MAGMQQHPQNTGISDTSQEKTCDSCLKECFSGIFVVRVDEEVLFSLTLTTQCEFFLIDYQSYEQINGGYSITDKITKGSISTIVFSIEGEPFGEGIIAWPLENDLCIVINGVAFRKIDKTKH